MRRKVAVNLPAEALEAGEDPKGTVGVLELSLYGTRDAATNFQKEVRELMTKLGFQQSQYNASLYHHPKSRVQVLVHGDDFVAVGRRREVENFKTKLAERVKVKNKIIGPCTAWGDLEEAGVLNRVIRYTQEGWEYEPDQRHVDLIIQAKGDERREGS